MVNRLNLRRPLPVIAVGVLAVALIGGGTAVAADLVTGNDVKDGSLRVQDLSDRAVARLQKGGDSGDTGVRGLKGTTGAKGDHGAPGSKGADGSKGDHGTKGDDATFVGPNWSIVDRNVIGNGDSYLRAGPDNAPMGQGSLGIRTGASSDAANFGNQVDFQGDLVSDLNRVGYWVFTTGENRATSVGNLPNVKFEIDPNLTASNFSTLVFVPNAVPAGWTEIDAAVATTGYWYLTGSGGTDSGCTQATACSFAAAKAALPAATIYTVQVGKGRDWAFSGAVDALRINKKVYDFEPFGVIARTP